MIGDFFRYYKPKFLVVFILGSGTILGPAIIWIAEFFNSTLDISFWQYPSTSGVLVMLLLLIDKFWWNKKTFSWLFWVPDISGEYEGHIRYNNPVTNTLEEKDCKAVIHQTGSKIKFEAIFSRENGIERTTSVSLVSSIIRDDHDQCDLVFTFRNEGNPTVGFQAFYGTNILKIDTKNKALSGTYYTNREPQTKGEMELQLKD